MKKLIILFIFITIFFSSCDLYTDEINDKTWTEKASNHTLFYHIDFEVIQTLDDISRFVMNAVDYQSESSDVWSDPEDVYLRGYGDCDDIVLLANNIAKVMFDFEYDIVFVDHSTISKYIIQGGYVDHMMSYLRGNVFEAQQSMTSPYNGTKVSFLYYFDEVFTQASPSYTEYRKTKTYDSYLQTWYKALDPNRSYIAMAPDGEWKIINQ